MRSITTILLILMSVSVYGQDLYNPATIGQTSRNQKVGNGLQVEDTTLLKGVLVIPTGAVANKVLTTNADGLATWENPSDVLDSLNVDTITTVGISATNASLLNTGRPLTSNSTTNVGTIYRDSTNTVQVDRCVPWTCNDSLDVILTDTTANVGIGTSTPSAALHVVNSAIIDSAGYILRVGTRVPSFGFSAGAGASKEIDDTTEYFNGVFYENDLLSNFVGWMAINDNSNYLAYSRFSRSYGTEINGGDLSFSITNLSSLNYIDGNQAEGYVLTSDASGDATWQDPTAWGEMGFGDSTSTQALTQNVWHVVTNGNEDLWASAVVDTHAVTYSNDSLIIAKAGTYSVHAQLSVDGSTSSIIRLGIYINGALACTCTGYQELTNNTVVQLNYINIDQLNEGDVLQVVITNTANNDDVDAIGGKLAIHKID